MGTNITARAIFLIEGGYSDIWIYDMHVSFDLYKCGIYSFLENFFFFFFFWGGGGEGVVFWSNYFALTSSFYNAL